MIEFELYKLNPNGLPMKNEGITEISNEGIENNGTSGIIIDILREGQAGRQMIVDIVRLPYAQFSADHTGGCAPHSVQFSGSDSLYADSYQYSFGDGATSGEQNISHEYTASGLYTVALTAHSDLALADDTLSRYQYIEVLTPPIADFYGTPTSGQATLPVSFTADCTGDVSNYIWAFGDGQTSGSQNPSHSYTAAGTFGVALTAGNKYCSDYMVKDNYISVSPAGPTYQWVSKVSPDYWEPFDAHWTGSGWTGDAYEWALRVKSGTTWANGYRPLKIRLTVSVNGKSIILVSTAWETLFYDGSYQPGQEYDLNWGSGNIYQFIVSWQALTITDIEFYEEV